MGLSENGRKTQNSGISRSDPNEIFFLTYSEPARRDDFGKVGHFSGSFKIYLGWLQHHCVMLSLKTILLIAEARGGLKRLLHPEPSTIDRLVGRALLLGGLAATNPDLPVNTRGSLQRL